MSESYIPGQPGVRTAKTAAHRRVFLQGGPLPQFIAKNILIDGSKSRDPGNTGDLDVLRPGVLMGKITSGGLWAPSAYGLTTNAEAIGSTAIEATAAVVTELVRRGGASGTFKLIGPPTAGGAVSVETVTYSAASGTTITVTALVNAFVAASIIAPVDGSEYPQSFVPDGWGIKVTDSDNSTNLTVEFPQVPIAGIVDFAQLLPAVSDASLKQWVIAQLTSQGMGNFTFNTNY